MPGSTPLLWLVALTPAAAPSVQDVRWSAPVPAWVEAQALPTETLTATAVEYGVEHLLVDDELRVDAGQPAKFGRRARRVRTAEGLESAGEIRLSWSPSWQTLGLHWIRVHRGGRVLEPTRPSDGRVLQRERDLEEGLVDGESTLVVFVPGLQVGDIVDVAYGIRGANPALRGRYAASFDLGWTGHRVHVRSLRVLWRGPHPLHVRGLGGAEDPEVRPTRWGTEYRWRRSASVPSKWAAGAPSWHVFAPMVQLSDFESWRQVAAWGLPSYRVPDPPPPALQAWLSKVRDEPEEVRFLAAVTFVRRDIRYLGFEIGENTLKPHPPEQVFTRRYGDCKDTSFLLVTLLHHLGIRAAPALVSTEWTTEVDRLHPSTFAFDHVVVRAEVAGQVRWIDTTMSHEPGGYEAWTPLPARQALVLDEATTGLVDIPDPAPEAPDKKVLQTLDLDGPGHDATLTVTSWWRRAQAQSLRRRVAQAGEEALQAGLLDFWRERYENARVHAPLEIVDHGHEVELREAYYLPNQDRRDTAADGWAVAGVLREVELDPEIPAPLRLPRPTRVEHTIVLHDPEVGFEFTSRAETVEGPGLELTYAESADGPRAEVRYAMIVDRDAVSAAEAPAYAEAVRRALKLVPLTYTSHPGDEGGGGGVGMGFTLFGGVVGLGFTAFFLFLLSRSSSGPTRARPGRRGRAFKRATQAARGETAQYPYLLGSADELEGALGRHRCGCGAKGRWISRGEPSGVRIGGRAVQSAPLACEACGEPTHVYFEVSS